MGRFAGGAVDLHGQRTDFRQASLVGVDAALNLLACCRTPEYQRTDRTPHCCVQCRRTVPHLTRHSPQMTGRWMVGVSFHGAFDSQVACADNSSAL
jgi:hypothetical protein